MAGPWFTVRKSNSDFAKFGELWISNGTTSERAVLEYKVRFESVAADVDPLWVPDAGSFVSMISEEEETP